MRSHRLKIASVFPSHRIWRFKKNDNNEKKKKNPHIRCFYLLVEGSFNKNKKAENIILISC